MQVLIHQGKIKGPVQSPSSKSYTIRGLMCAALAPGQSQIIRPLYSDDTEAACRVLESIGVSLTRHETAWTVDGGSFHQSASDLFCQDSAATLRFMTAIGALVPGKCRLTAGKSLSKRPIEPLILALQQLGVKCSAEDGHPPVDIEYGLAGGVTSLPGNISSQYVSAILLAAPLAANNVVVKLSSPLESKAYISMTLECLEKFGIHVLTNERMDNFEIKRQRFSPAIYQVEGDWSSASYLLAAGALAGEIEVQNLNVHSLQGDRVIINLLQKMGASISVSEQAITVKKSQLIPIKADLNESIDLLPTMAVLAAAAKGKSEFSGISRARLKESDRIDAVAKGLMDLGINVTAENDRILITGGTPTGTSVNSFNDHRIAMAFSLLGMSFGNITIKGAECVSKTYPEFWDILKRIGGNIEIIE